MDLKLLSNISSIQRGRPLDSIQMGDAWDKSLEEFYRVRASLPPPEGGQTSYEDLRTLLLKGSVIESALYQTRRALYDLSFTPTQRVGASRRTASILNRPKTLLTSLASTPTASSQVDFDNFI